MTALIWRRAVKGGARLDFLQNRMYYVFKRTMTEREYGQ